MRVLLDTCAVAELRHPRGNPLVKTAIALVPDEDLFVSALMIAEISEAISLLTDIRKKRNLIAWLTALESQFADRILPVDGRTAHVWGDISALAQQAGFALPIADGLLAATALRHGLWIMTRSKSHFAVTGALIVDPWRTLALKDTAE